MMAAKTSPEIRAEIIKLFKAGGWSHAALERKFGITATTIRMIVDQDYNETRRRSINENRLRRPPPSEIKRRAQQHAISLAKV